jgi:phage terminase large subunit
LTEEVKIKFKASPVFFDIQECEKKIVLCRGGTRSSKTMSLCLLALNWLCDSDEEGYWSICRKTLPALKATALRDFEWLIEATERRVFYNKSERTFHRGNRVVEFFSLDDEQKIRSRKRRHLHLVEANEVNFHTFTQLAIRTSGKIYLDFNPDDIDSWLNQDIEIKRSQIKGDVDVVVSTYLDNPFLTDDEVAEIEYLRTVDPELWAIFGEGRYGKMTGVIFKGYQLVDTFPDHLDPIIGLDWGFSKDPNAAVKVGKQNNSIYMDELFYQKGLINSEISKLLPKDVTIVADSAEPKSIEDLRRMGHRIVPSLKGPDSVRNGIDNMLKYDLFVTKSSVNLIKELNHYKRDADGDIVDAYNHLLDAARYVIQTKFRKSTGLRII